MGMNRSTRGFAASLLVALVPLTGVVACSDTGAEPAAAPTTSADPSGGSATGGEPNSGAPPEATTVAELLELDRPIVLSHSGGENAHPQATPFAYAESVEAGVDMLDFDVRLSADGVLVAHHDEDVQRTTNGSGEVRDMTYDDLHALDAAYWFTDACSACSGEPEEAYPYRGVRTGEADPPEGYGPDDFAPTAFEEIIVEYPDHTLNIEIKGSYPQDVPAAEELARILESNDRVDQAVVTAFDDELAEAFHELLPEVAITPGLAAMTSYVLGGVALPPERNIVQIPPEYEGVELLTEDFVRRAHGDGLVLWIWPNDRSIENRAGYAGLLEMGVDGINAADPAEAVAVLQGQA